MDKKRCPKCDKHKFLKNFSKDNSRKNGLKVYCKECASEERKKYYEKNVKKEKKYREENKDKQKEYNINYYSINKEKIITNSKQYYYSNKSKKLEYSKQYRKENKEKINTYRRNKYKKEPHINAWRSILKNTIKRMNTIKEKRTIEELGFSAGELKLNMKIKFTEGMSWDNYGEWHIDHIKPVSSFDKNTLAKIVCALDNLQPLWSTTRKINGVIYEGNLNKNNKLI